MTPPADPSRGFTIVFLVLASWVEPSRAPASEVAVPLATARLETLTIKLPVGADTVLLEAKLSYDSRGRITGEAAIDGAPALVKGKQSTRKGVTTFSITFRGLLEKLKVSGVVGSNLARVTYSGPKGKAKVKEAEIGLAATQGSLAGTFDVAGLEDEKGRITATGSFVSGFGNDPAGDGVLKGRIKKQRISFLFKSGKQRVSFKGVLTGDLFVGVLKISSPPAKEVIRGFELSPGFLLEFNPTVRVTSFTSDKARVQVREEATLTWTLAGTPTEVTLEPGIGDVTAVLSKLVVPFPESPIVLDPRASFKVAAVNLATDTEVFALDSVRRSGGAGAGDVDRDAITSIALLPDGGAYVVGNFSGTMTLGEGEPNARTLTAEGGTDMFLARYNADGSLDFAQQIRSTGSRDDARGVTALPDGGAVVTGALDGTATLGDDPDPSANFTLDPDGDTDVFLAGYDREGAVVFAFSSGRPMAEAAGTAVAAYPDGGFLVGAASPDASGVSDTAVAKILPVVRGGGIEVEFQQLFEGPGSDQATAVATFADGSGAFSGVFEGTVTLQSGALQGGFLTSRGGRDAFVAKIDPEGEIIFMRQISGPGDEGAFGLATYANGDVVVTGSFQGKAADFQALNGLGESAVLLAAGGETDFDIFVARYDFKGNIVFAVRAGGEAAQGGGAGIAMPLPADEGRAVVALGDGSAVVTGFFSGTATFGDVSDARAVSLTSFGGRDFFAARLDAKGKFFQASRAGGQGDDEGTALAGLPEGGFLATGVVKSEAVFGDGEAHETQLVPLGRQDGFVARFLPVNYALLDLRPEGLASARVLGSESQGTVLSARPDGTVWAAGVFSGTLLLRDDPDPLRRIALTSVSAPDIFLARFNAERVVDAAVLITTAGDQDRVFGIAALPDGGVAVTGIFKESATFAPGVTLASQGPTDMFLARYADNPGLVFARRGGSDGNDGGRGVAARFDGNALFVVGFLDSGSAATFPGGAGGIDVPATNRGLQAFVARYDVSGNPLFVVQAGGSGSDFANGVAVSPDSSFWVTGQMDSASALDFESRGANGDPVIPAQDRGDQAILAHYDANGHVFSAKVFGGPGFDAGLAVAAATDGGAVFAGAFQGQSSFGDPPGGEIVLRPSGARDIFLARVDGNASLVYAKSAGGLVVDLPAAVAVLPDGSALLTGSFTGQATFGEEGGRQAVLDAVPGLFSQSSADMFLARFAPDGTLVFARSAGGGGDDLGSGLAALTDGRAFVAGSIASSSGFMRQGPPIVFGRGEANEFSLEDPGNGFRFFLAEYFPYDE